MAVRKRTIVRIETNSLALIRPASTPVDLWCEECAVKVPMLTAEAFAARAGTTARDVYRRVEMGALHFNETVGGALLVCTNSLSPQTQGEIEQRLLKGKRIADFCEAGSPSNPIDRNPQDLEAGT